MSLVPVRVLLGLKLLAQLVEHRGQQLGLAGLVVGVARPDGDLDRVPADAVRDAADVVVEGWTRVSTCFS